VQVKCAQMKWLSNTTPHADAREVPAPASAVGVRADGHER
jgi:hypothetical protein